jgi:hypothetical protein
MQSVSAPRMLGGVAGIGRLSLTAGAAQVRAAAVACKRFLLSDLFSIFLATRLCFVLLTYFGRALMRDPALVGPGRTGFSGYLLDSWFYRDSQWFQQIVAAGYSYYGAGVRSTVAFFPVYPALVRLLTQLTGLSVDLAAMAVANVAFLVALVFMHKLCAREYGEATARRAVLYMAIFPTAFFSFAPYSESTFLLFAIASLYFMRTERWWLAGLFGGIAAGTRILGFLLFILFVVEYARSIRIDGRRLRPNVLAGLLIPGGLVAYMVYLYGLTGDPLAFVHAAAGWDRGTVMPWKVLLTSLSDIPKSAVHQPYFHAHAIVENALLVACIVVLIAGVRLIPLSFTLFGLACIGLLLSAPDVTSDIPITSMSRYLFVVVPVYVVLARLGRLPTFDRLYVLLSAGSLALFTTLFLNHMWGA